MTKKRSLMCYIFFLFISSLCLMQEITSVETPSISNKQTEYFEATKCLNKACKLAQKIKNEEVKMAVLGELESCKEYFSEKLLPKEF